MNVVIYQSFIIHFFVLFYGVYTLSVEINGNVTKFLGENGTEIECSYTKENVISISSVSFLAFNRTSTSFIAIAFYIPNVLSYLTEDGQYLQGRVTLMNITQSTKKAVITFNKLTCIDDTRYQCKVNYITLSDNREFTSNDTSISVQVLPSKPDSVSIMQTPADSSPTTTKHVAYSTSVLSSEVTTTSSHTKTLPTLKMEKQNDTTVFNNSTLTTTNNFSSYSTPSNDNVSSDTTYEATTYSSQQTTTSQDIITEGENITIVCSGDVGKPPADHFFQKYRVGHSIPQNYTVTKTSISEISDNCSYYRTSNLTFQVTAEDNQAVIRCAVDSSMAESDRLYVETEQIEVYYDIPTTQSSSTSSSSGVDKKEEKSNGDLGLVIGIVVAVVTVIVVLIVIIACRRWKSKSPTFKNVSNSLNDSKPKPIPEPRTGDYDYIALEDDAPKSSNNGLEVEDINKHNEEYLKKQEEEEKKKNESNTPPQPAVYAQVNEASKLKNKQKTETPDKNDKQEEDPYAETHEGVYDEAGNPRYKENKNAEQFDVSTNSSKHKSNDDNKLSIQTSQVGSYANQGFEKDENRKVATVSPTVRSSSGSQNDEQTNSNRNSQSKKEYENIIGTDQTGILEEESSHRTAL